MSQRSRRVLKGIKILLEDSKTQYNAIHSLSLTSLRLSLCISPLLLALSQLPHSGMTTNKLSTSHQLNPILSHNKLERVESSFHFIRISERKNKIQSKNLKTAPLTNCSLTFGRIALEGVELVAWSGVGDDGEDNVEEDGDEVIVESCDLADFIAL